MKFKIFIIILSLAIPIETLAVSDADRHSILMNTPYYDPSTCPSDSGSGTTDSTTSPTDTSTNPASITQVGTVPSGWKIPAGILTNMNKNKDAYFQAAAKYKIPWQMIAAVHFKEGGNSPSQDIQAGTPLPVLSDPGSSVDDAYAIYHLIPLTTMEQSAEGAAEEMITKASEVGDKINVSKPSDAAVKEAFYGKNGRAYGSADNSPYVMNGYDSAHMNMTLAGGGTDANVGAFVIYVLLGGSSGNAPTISSTSGGDCCSSATVKPPAPASSSDLSFTDTSRGNRKVGTTVYTPGDSRPHPLILFAPGRYQNASATGNTSTPAGIPTLVYSRYLSALASEGFVVAGVNFSDNTSYAAVPQDAQDVKFLISKLEQDSSLQGKISTANGVGLIGHSDGGMIALIDGYAQGKKDSRISAVMSEDGALYSGMSWGSGPPLLLMHGTADTTENISSSVSAFNTIKGPYQGFIKVLGADHYHYIIDSSSSYLPAVNELTSAFMKRVLSGDGSDATNLSKLVSQKFSSLVSLQEKGSESGITGQTDMLGSNGSSSSGSDTPATSSSGCCPNQAGASGSPSTLIGNSDAEKVWNYLTGTKGLSTTSAAAIMGNFTVESGFSPTIYNGTHHTNDPNAAGSYAWGLAQWLPATKVFGIQKSSGASGNIYDLSTQLDMVWWQASTNNSPAGGWDFQQFKNITDVTQATLYWLDHFEGAPGQLEQERINAAHVWVNKAGGSGGNAPGVPSGQNCDQGATLNSQGYTNPFEGDTLTPSRIDQGVDYGSGSTGPIRAIGDADIVYSQPSGTGWGPYSCSGGYGGAIVYRLTSGTYSGKYVFVAEGIVPTVQSGHVTAGQQIATFKGCIETGWASGSGDQPAAQLYGQESSSGDAGSNRTYCGNEFWKLLTQLGVQTQPNNLTAPIVGTSCGGV